MTFNEDLNAFVDFIPTIPAEKRYWLIRTKSGQFYETFRINNVVAIEHNEVSLHDIKSLRTEYKDDSSLIQASIKSKVRSEHIKKSLIDDFEEIELRQSSLIASQIFKFIFEVKKGDIVLIPSFNSDIVSFGVVNEGFIGDFSKEELRKIDTEAILIKRVTWISDLKRIELDPYLHRMFTAHQAINDVGNYADVIERSINDFFILDNNAHTIINIENENNIPASDLFNMGSEILALLDIVAQKYNLDFSSKDIQVTINLNSPGKIDFKSKIKSGTVLLGIILFLVGGGYEDNSGHSLKTDGVPGLIKTVNEVISEKHEREMQDSIFNKYKDSIKVKKSEDLIKLLKQFSENKDSSK